MSAGGTADGADSTTRHGIQASNVFQRQISQSPEQFFSTATETIQVMKKQTEQSNSTFREAAHFDLLRNALYVDYS